MNNHQQKNALSKYLTIGLVRIIGIAMMAVGFAILLNDFMQLSDGVAYFLIVMGGFAFIVLPILLARAWKTPDEGNDADIECNDADIER